MPTKFVSENSSTNSGQLSRGPMYVQGFVQAGRNPNLRVERSFYTWLIKQSQLVKTR